MVATRALPLPRRVIAAIAAVLLIAVTLVVIGQQSAEAKTASGKTAASTQLVPVAKITGVPPLLWIPAGKTLTLQCLATGEKVNGAVASADPYYFRVTYGGQLGYVSDSDLYTSKAANKLGLSTCKTTLPAEPTKPAAGSVTASSVKLSWGDASNNEAGFKTQYSTNGGKTWKAGPTAAANAKSITISGLSSSKKYTFQVGASNSAGTKWSKYVVATTKKAPAVAAKVDAFVTKWNGKAAFDRDGVAGAQCVDLFKQYDVEVMGGNGPATGGTGGAYEYWNTFGGGLSNRYTKVAGTESAKKGDVAIWSDKLPNGTAGLCTKNGCGHVAIVLEDKGSSLVIFTQNPGGPHKATMSKSYLLGYLRPKA